MNVFIPFAIVVSSVSLLDGGGVFIVGNLVVLVRSFVVLLIITGSVGGMMIGFVVFIVGSFVVFLPFATGLVVTDSGVV